MREFGAQYFFSSLFQVATGEVDMAIGGDQGGSIRMPAASCGIVGLKPTMGLVPYTGISSIELTLDHTGPMARTVYDTALLLEVNNYMMVLNSLTVSCIYISILLLFIVFSQSLVWMVVWIHGSQVI